MRTLHLFHIALILLLLPRLLTAACIHDTLTRNHSLAYVDDRSLHHGRLLQNLGFGPMRIYYEYNTTTITEGDVVGRNIMRIMNIIGEFWARTIEVDYVAGLSFNIPQGMNSAAYQCLSFTVPQRLILGTVPNKDFGLLVEAQDDGDSGVTAYSFPCAASATTKRPLWGFVHWNKRYMSFNPVNFQQNIHIGIHQIIHVLGFSQTLYPNFQNSRIFVNINGNMYLNGSYIRREVIRQYGCVDPPGMALETNGGTGTALSHWSRKTALNELMTAGVSVNNPTISYITLALLEETGWYRRVFRNLGRFINFGFRKGCAMLSPSNCSSNEYCTVKDQIRPDYDRTALGYCRNDSLSNCLYVKFYINFICTDPNYADKSLHADQGIINVTGCYVSDLRLAGQQTPKYSFRCYQTICSPNRRTLTLRVGSTLAFCMFPNQLLRIPGYDGTVRCPESFLEMCAVTRCQAECNGNGICLGGQCLCEPSFTGPDCSQLTSLGFASKVSVVLPGQNGNCLIGSYRSQFGDCVPCGRGCIRCNFNGCLLCTNDRIPAAGVCQ